MVVYIPTERPITINMASLNGPAKARWFDPTNGAWQDVSGDSLPNSGSKRFTPPGKNHAGDGDWVLLLESSAASH